MRVIIYPDAETASVVAAQFVAKQVQRKPDSVIGMATGSSPLKMYRELVRMHQEEGLDFSAVTTFNLDEYIGLEPGHPQSYHAYMHEHLFRHLNIPSSQINIPDGRAFDFERFCADYERGIKQAGGIDLQVLGIGYDGHIAFNEPGSSLGSRTRIKTLTSETVRDNARFFPDESQVPRVAITMGVGTILESRRCLLLAFGEHKAQAIHATVEGPVTAQVTASALQLHRDVIVIVDEAAASMLARKDYYSEVEKMENLLAAGKIADINQLRPR
jgi:glucosamine-6-phosphate deaminase